MSWSDACSRCNQHKADCECRDGYLSVLKEVKSPNTVEFIFKTQGSIGIFEIKANGKHWTSFHTLDPILDKKEIIKKAKLDLLGEGISDVKINYNCPYW